MKREFLEAITLDSGARLSKEAIDAIMAENGRDIEAHKAAKETLAAQCDALKADLDSTAYSFAVRDAARALKFTSESAKKAFIADLTDKKLPLEDGTLHGLDEFTKNYREADPGAFAPDTETKIPVAVRGGMGAGLTPDPLSSMRSVMGLN